MNEPRERASRYIDAILGNSGYTHGDRLPSMAQLARCARVSTQAMAEAVGNEVGKGRIVSLRGSGIYVGNVTTTHSPSKAAKKWERVRDAMARDIVTRFGADPANLPSLSVLGTLYAASYPTIRKALDGLGVDVGYESPDTSAVRRRMSPRQGQGSVLFVSLSDERGNVAFINRRLSEFLDALYKKADASGVRLHAVPMPVDVKHPGRIMHDQSDGFLLGTVIWANGLPQRAVNGCVREACAQGKPLVVIDETGEYVPHLDATPPQLSQVITIDNRRAAESIAASLDSTGHRHVAFLSSSHSHPWSTQRFAGLQRYARMRTEGRMNVSAFTMDLPMGAAQAGKTRDGPAPVTAIDLLTRSRDLARRAAIASFLRRDLMHGFSEAIRWEHHHTLIDSLFERALEHREISAWVMVHDYTANYALEYLDKNAIMVPQTISIVSFDNTEDALYSGLASFDFGFTAMASYALGFVLNPRSRMFGSSRRVVEWEGTLVRRASLGDGPSPG